jgi:cytochrome d ubiquinol oxidase subunit I
MTAASQTTYLKAASQMQALSFAVHIPLVCFGIALPALVLLIEWMSVRTGDPLYRTIAKRWTRIMATLFAVGVITGTVLSFEMGILWPAFMAKFGSVFGLGFSIEGFAFFTEAIFMGIYVYGWNRMSARVHLLSGIPVVIAGFLGALMVLSVNAWMQHPSGFRLSHGKVTHVHPLAALFGNSFLWNEMVHMYLAAFMVTGFLMAGAYAVQFLRGRWGRYERTAFAVPFTVAGITAPVQILVGDWVARDIAVEQPTKLAAIEGLTHTTHGASEHILGWYVNGRLKFAIGIPHMLSLLSFHSWNAKIQGLDAVPFKDRPPINITRVSFQLMVGIGTLLALAGVVFLIYRWRKRRLPMQRWFYALAVITGPLSIVALIAGWIVTEVGRQPWVVYGVMTSAQAVTHARGIPIGYGVLAAAYILVAAGLVWILVRLARSPLGSADSALSTTDHPPNAPAAGTA